MDTIEINDIGPIDHLSIDLPEGGGVVVLQGDHGSGKSTTLDAVNARLGGDGDGLSVRDGKKRGSVTIGDAKLTVSAKQKRKSGSLEVSEIESRFDISDLVDGGNLKSDEAREAFRLKALVKLSGVEANHLDYDCLADMDEIRAVDLNTDDPIVLQSRIKRHFEKVAREHETKSKQTAATINVYKDEIDGVPLGREHDETKLQKAYDDAKTAYDKAEASRETALRIETENAANAQRLKEVVEQYDGDDASSLCCRHTDAVARHSELLENVALVEKNIVELDNQIKRAQDHEKLVNALKPKGTPVNKPPTEKEVAHLFGIRDKAFGDITRGTATRDARQKVDQIENLQRDKKMNSHLAKQARENAAKTEEILSDLVKVDNLRIVNGRLVTSTDRDECEPYDQLSHGERFKLAIDLAVNALPDGGVLTICQEAWDALNGPVRQQINLHAKQCGCWILTAQASEGELRV